MKHDDKNRFLTVCQLPIFCNRPRKNIASNLNDYSPCLGENSADKHPAGEGRSMETN